MIQDRGPAYNLGFGVNSRDVNQGQATTSGASPTSGGLSKALADHPVMRFFAVSAATLVSAAVAGQVVRKGGVRLGAAIQESGKFTKEIGELRRVRDVVDDWQGVVRAAEGYTEDNKGKLFWEHPEGNIKTAGKTLTDGRAPNGELTTIRGWHQSYEEQLEMARYGASTADPDAIPPGMWTIKDELTQRMVSQARALPYELPAMYVAQRGITDKLFGTGPEEKNVNWANPLDVIADFATLSLKNTATMVLPFSAAQGSAAHGWRSVMTAGDGLSTASPLAKGIAPYARGLKDLLGEVGHDAAKVANQAIKYSSQASGAFSTAVKVASENQINVVDFMHQTRSGTAKAIDRQQYKGINRSQIWAEKARGILNLKGPDERLYGGNPLDVLPGPFKGMGSGWAAGKQQWSAIGDQKDAVNLLLNKGHAAFLRETASGDRLRVGLNEAMQVGGSPAEELLGSLNRLSGGSPVTSNGRVNRAWKEGEFYQGRLNDAYNAKLRLEMARHNISEEAINRFQKVVGVQAPLGKRADYSNRFRMNGKALQVGSKEEIWQEMATKMNIKDNAFVGKAPQALERADQFFNSKKFMRSFDKQAVNEWHLFYNETFPKFGESVLGKARLSHDMFEGKLTAAKHSYLTRKTAELSGLRMRNDVGDIVSDGVVNNHLRRFGHDPANTGQLRAYLTQKKALSAPWNRSGGNIFGFRPVTIDSAIERGYFDKSPANKAASAGYGGGADNEIRRLARSMSSRDPVSPLGSVKMGGMHISKHGEVVDLNVVRRGGRKFMDKLSQEFQIPLIHLNPLRTAGYSSVRNMRESSMIQYVSGQSPQPFIGGGGSADFHMWTRAKARGSKGNLTAFKWDRDSGTLRDTVLPGKYRAIQTSGNTIEAHGVKLGARDLGRIPAARLDANGNPRESTRFEKFKDAFNISDHQPDSIINWSQRFRARKTDLGNPVLFSKLLRGETVSAGKSSLVMDFEEGVVKNATTGKVTHNAKTVAEHYDKFGDNFKNKGFARKAERHIGGDNNPFKATFKEEGTVIGKGEVHLNDLKSPAQFIEYGDKLAKDNILAASSMGKEVQDSIRRAQSSTISRHLKNEPSASRWDGMAPGAAAGGSISTRQQQYVAELQKYMILIRGLMSGNPAGFETSMSDIVVDLGKMRSAGAISQVQYIESRAALLGVQSDFSNFAHFNRASPVRSNTQAAMRHFGASEVNKDLLGDISSGKFDTMSGRGWAGRFGKVQPYLTRKFGTAKYDYSGQEYNPFGNGAAMVPTFGTTLARNPRSAIASVMGLNTWSNPSAFSGASIPSGHLVDRINKSFGLLGLSLDQSAFKGPVDMYARGLIGKRALPIVAGGTTAVALDRTLGGFVNPKDRNGERVYSPLLLGKAATGIAYGQAAISGAVPGGPGFEEKKQSLMEGEVPIRAGRWWPLGNTPFKGGRIEYFRPSWYRRLKSGYSYTSDTYGTPLQRLMYGHDFSPLRPLDPYRFERQHYKDRPYPVSGEYFSGPWGPMRSALNATVGRVLKPQIRMHKDEVNAGFSQYLPAGDQGAYLAPPGSAGALSVSEMGSGGGRETGGSFRGSIFASGGPTTSSGVSGGGGMISSSNRNLAAAGRQSLGTGRNMAFGAISGANQSYSDAASSSDYAGNYGPVAMPGAMPPKVVGAAKPISTRNIGYQSRQFGYELQEMAGIYGFAFGSAREALGFGSQDFDTPRPVLESASKAYGSTRGFWGLGLGGLGDIPSPLEGSNSNIEFSEVVRRFIPRERSGTQFMNPIKNQMGEQHPWLPDTDSGYYLDFSKGDPMTRVSEGEMRMPGQGYERFNKTHPDAYGKYGMVDAFKILGDVAPWSAQYRSMAQMVDGAAYGSEAQNIVATTRAQVDAKSRVHEFSPYESKYTIPTSLAESAKVAWEKFSHYDSPFNTKFLHKRTAVEDWERDNVYGSTFPQWQHPIRDFVEPMLYKSTQRNPLHAALILGGTGTLFGSSSEGKVIGAVVGAGLGFAASTIGNIKEKVSGMRYMPEQRRKEVALEEYMDIMSYVKNTHLANQASTQGDMVAAAEYQKQASNTMYGVDVYKAPLHQLAKAIPKRKREHFRAMVDAPEQERDQILSTAGRLERRALEAVWGRPVEAKPDLGEYFEKHELPDSGSSIWNPNTNMEEVKIKVGQSQGLDMAQMGYYPQQIQEANLVNPAYPSMFQQNDQRNIKSQLRDLIHRNGMSGDVTAHRTAYPGTRLQIDAGIF